jgi:O-methyltransferase involved in polyketide biosynthesis
MSATSTASRTVVAGDFRWQDRLAAWALIQGFDERERAALSDCRD